MVKGIGTVRQKEILDAYDTYSTQYANQLGLVSSGRTQELFGQINQEMHPMIIQNLFWMVLNLKDRRIQFTAGLKDALGYNDIQPTFNGLPIRDMLSWINPHRLQLFLQFAHASYAASIQYRNLISEGSYPCYRIRVPMKHSNGNYYWVYQSSFPLEVDDQGMMISQVNQHFMGHPYKGELLEPPELLFKSIGFSKIRDGLMMEARQYFRHILDIRFDPIHGKIFEIYFQNPEAGIKDIERITGWKSMDIKNYQRKILRIASEYFHYPFTTCKEAVHYLHRIGWQYEVLRE